MNTDEYREHINTAIITVKRRGFRIHPCAFVDLKLRRCCPMGALMMQNNFDMKSFHPDFVRAFAAAFDGAHDSVKKYFQGNSKEIDIGYTLGAEYRELWKDSKV